MTVILFTTACSEKMYSSICSKRKMGIIDSGQKFFSSIAESLAINGLSVYCIVSRPISFSTYPQRFLRRDYDEHNGVKYLYLPIINLPFLRSIFLKQAFRREYRRISNKSQNEFVLCDTLLLEASSLIRRNNSRIPFISVVTDIPFFVDQMIHSKGIKRLLERHYSRRADSLIKEFDGYILLTEAMNSICNPKNKPHIVMECITKDISFPLKKKISNLPVVLYAGKLLKDCGVVELAKSAEYLAGKCEIWLYGSDCDCLEDLLLLCKKNVNLKIHDAVPYEELYSIESSSSILINPRPADKEFVEYSFPSKTIEYLQSGVPVLMFKLPSVPSEYDDYVFYIKKYNPISIAQSICEVLSIPSSIIFERTKRAKEFAKTNKGIEAQGVRIVNFLESFSARK